MTLLRTSSCTLFAGAMLAVAASAQTITWGPVLPSVAPADVSTNGALVFAGNAHNPNVAAIPATVNGVTFAGGFHPANWNGYITGGLNGSTTGNTEFDKLLANSLAMQTSPSANPTGWGGIRLDTLATLNPGYTYEIQVWFTDQRTGTPTNVLYDRVMTLSSAFGTATLTGGEVTNVGAMLQGPLSGPMDADPDNAPAASSPDTVFGTHCTGTFVYSPAAELWLIIRGTHPLPTNVLAPHITALQIRDLSSAAHQNFGTGCHSYAVASPTETFYQDFADAALASAALQGNAMLLVPTGTGYSANWLPAAAGSLFLAPSGAATSLPTTDDGDTAVTLPGPFPSNSGGVTAVRVSHNGILTLAGTANNPNDYTPTGAEIATQTGEAFYTWSDFRDSNLTPVASGTIKTELVGNVFCITWDNVDHWTNPQVTAPSQWQFQLDLVSGTVTYVWVTIDANTTSTFGSAYTVGYTGPGSSTNPGSITLSTALPIVTNNNQVGTPMTLTAAPAPVINPSTLVTYTIGNIPEFLPGSGVYLSTMFLSLNPLPGGFDLAGILTTVPGCKAYIGTLDVNIGTALTLTPTSAVPFTFAQPFFAPGNVIAAQAVALFDSTVPLPNGEAGGFLVSNGVKSTTQLQ